ncbi:hypothetical protein FHR97_003262, partial [Halomonas stenophila]|nr:hypothetical protein [Halomonas stenophila]
QGVIWNINSFDQWGVQLGKRIAGEISSRIDEHSQDFDGSTQGLLTLVRSHFPAQRNEPQEEPPSQGRQSNAKRDSKARKEQST